MSVRRGRLAYLCFAFVFGVLQIAPVEGQSSTRRGLGGVELNGYAGGFFGNGAEFATDSVRVSVEDDVIVGARLGYVFRGGFSIEGNFGWVDSKAMPDNNGSTRTATMLAYGGRLGYNLNLADPVQIFVQLGAGAQSWDISQFGSQTSFAFDYGAGLKFFLARSLAVRLDWHNYVVPDGLDNFRQSQNPGVEKQTLTNTEFSGGLSVFLGGPQDSDGDGVPDDQDLCPDTPEGVLVDTRGCPFDTDGDGVYDYLDQCPDTPRGATVDANGCPMDSDGDGVFDGLDQCQNTPAGATVDANGCPTDSDGDGVYDGIDQCPGTPEGATVDAAGCPMDSDGDGVYDGIDQCPRTPPGAQVDERGCIVRLELQNIEFEFASATLTDQSRAVLDGIAGAIHANVDPQGTAVLELRGHTDSVGSESYNQGLSERRAQAVLDYMFETEPRLQAYEGRFVARGYGETQPIADNDTDEGRQRNRRVELVVLGG